MTDDLYSQVAARTGHLTPSGSVPSWLDGLLGGLGYVGRAVDVPRQMVLQTLAGRPQPLGRALAQVTDPDVAVGGHQAVQDRWGQSLVEQYPLAATLTGAALEFADPLLVFGIPGAVEKRAAARPRRVGSVIQPAFSQAGMAGDLPHSGWGLESDYYRKFGDDMFPKVAIRLSDGRVISAPLKDTHISLLDHPALMRALETDGVVDDGFLDAAGKFYTRKEAMDALRTTKPGLADKMYARNKVIGGEANDLVEKSIPGFKKFLGDDTGMAGSGERGWLKPVRRINQEDYKDFDIMSPKGKIGWMTYRLKNGGKTLYVEGTSIRPELQNLEETQAALIDVFGQLRAMHPGVENVGFYRISRAAKGTRRAREGREVLIPTRNIKKILTDESGMAGDFKPRWHQQIERNGYEMHGEWLPNERDASHGVSFVRPSDGSRIAVLRQPDGRVHWQYYKMRGKGELPISAEGYSIGALEEFVGGKKRGPKQAPRTPGSINDFYNAELLKGGFKPLGNPELLDPERQPNVWYTTYTAPDKAHHITIVRDRANNEAHWALVNAEGQILRDGEGFSGLQQLLELFKD